MAMVNNEQTPIHQSKPNEGIQMHPELLIAAAHGNSDETKRLLPLLHREEDAERLPVEVVLDVVETIPDVETLAATTMLPSEAVTGAGDSVLHVVASSGDADEFLETATVIVRNANHLLRAHNGKGDTPLHCAVRLGNARMFSHLLALARGTSDERDRARDEGVKAILRMQNGKGETVLHEAVHSGDKEMIVVLLSADSQLARVPLTDGVSPLYLALSLGHWDIARQLIDKDKELSYSGPDGQNAFHAAIRWKGGQQMLLKRNKHLIKQADRSTGRTPLHLAALYGETRVTKLLLSADPSPAYLPDSEGSFPIHLAASNGEPDNVLALLKESSPYCAQLRDGKGRTFLHVAIEEERRELDDQGNTALHLAVQVGNIFRVRDLVKIREVKLHLTNNEGETPRQLAFIMNEQQGTNSHYSNPRSRIHWLLEKASPRENIVPRKKPDEKDRSQSIINRTQIIGLGSVLVTTVTFAAAFAMPGGYRPDGTPMLAGQYSFDAFVRANTLAFIFSGLSVSFLMIAGLGAEFGEAIVDLLQSINFLALSARSLGAAFAFGIYVVLAPVQRNNAFLSCAVTVAALMLVEFQLTTFFMAYNDNMALVARFGGRRAWFGLVWQVLLSLSGLAIYIIIAIPTSGYRRVH
ncbi:hypothetical protein VPH35_119754 [Triticum aestivum]